jgi:sugar phosphate isomerase/epimerase
MNEVFVSTGTVMDRSTGYDYSVIKTILPSICEKTGADGIEYLIMPPLYPVIDDVRRTIKDSGLFCPIIHAEKEIGILLSCCSEDDAEEAIRRWEINCREAQLLSARRIVLHLWGADESDSHFEYNVSFLPKIIEIANKFGVRPLIENIPCTRADPLTRWRQIAGYDVDFIYDVRFGRLHGQNEAIEKSELMADGRITHIHISDFGGDVGDFSRIRPVLHPGEGTVDFSALWHALSDAHYKGSFTLESPADFSVRPIDTKILTHSLSYLRQMADELKAKNIK